MSYSPAPSSFSTDDSDYTDDSSLSSSPSSLSSYYDSYYSDSDTDCSIEYSVETPSDSDDSDIDVVSFTPSPTPSDDQLLWLRNTVAKLSLRARVKVVNIVKQFEGHVDSEDKGACTDVFLEFSDMRPTTVRALTHFVHTEMCNK